MRRRLVRSGVGLLAAGVMASVSTAHAELVPPAGVGGCLWLAVSREARLEALAAYNLRGPGDVAQVPRVRREVDRRGRACVGGSSDLAVAGFASTAVRAGAALNLSRRGVEQDRLDAAWRAASPVDRGPFAALAQAYFASSTPEPPDTGRLLAPASTILRSAGLTADSTSLAEVVDYFRHTALLEAVESRLATPSAKPN